jgi:hypothetical protein
VTSTIRRNVGETNVEPGVMTWSTSDLIGSLASPDASLDWMGFVSAILVQLNGVRCKIWINLKAGHVQ